ncbi:MAG: hypothetical protein KBF73_03845, partial [Flavobacteriales bacterium]|nr:hypothetical protein [Flavobacteriales bacterium]
NLIPVLSVDYFPTVDGPAHLYNSKLISEIWRYGQSPIHQYLEFNQTATSNWSGHLLLSGLLMFCSAFWVEKAILLFYLIGFPLGIRYLLRASGVKSSLLIYLIFPFTYSFLFYYGFYNFNVGLVLFFFGVGLWLKSVSIPSISNYVKLGAISTLISLSHPFVFVLFLLTVFVMNLPNLMSSVTDSQNRIGLFKNLLFQFGSLSVGLVITAWFVLTEDTLQTSTRFIPWKDIIVSLKYIMPIKGIEPEAYNLLSRGLLYTFSGLLLVIGIGSLRNRVQTGGFKLVRPEWLMMSLTTLLLLFVAPDYMGTAGFISARLMWFFFVFLVIWLSLQKIPKWVSLVVFLVANGMTAWSVSHNVKAISKASSVAAEMVEVSALIEPNATVLPITIRHTKPFVHVSNYLGVDKPMILLYNYEAALSYFPLQWSYDKIAEQKLGTMTPSKCISWIGGKHVGDAVQIDYVCMVIEPGLSKHLECEDELNRNLAQDYELVYSNAGETVKLYRSLTKARD